MENQVPRTSEEVSQMLTKIKQDVAEKAKDKPETVKNVHSVLDVLEQLYVMQETWGKTPTDQRDEISPIDTFRSFGDGKNVTSSDPEVVKLIESVRLVAKTHQQRV